MSVTVSTPSTENISLYIQLSKIWQISVKYLHLFYS